MNTNQNKGDILAKQIEEILNFPYTPYSPAARIKKAIAEYRKPWTLGRSVNGFTLADGQQWHREDFTEDMLPEGWRPKLKGERKHAGMELRHQNGETGWYAYSASADETDSDRFYFFRTREPLPAVEKWSAEKHAFARGEAIQIFIFDWLDVSKDATVPWDEPYEFRVKPAPVLTPEQIAARQESRASEDV